MFCIIAFVCWCLLSGYGCIGNSVVSMVVFLFLDFDCRWFGLV